MGTECSSGVREGGRGISQKGRGACRFPITTEITELHPRSMVHMQSLLPEGATWSICGVGPNQFPAGIMASIMSGHIRVGLENNTRVLRGKLAEGSWEQVEVAKRIVELAEREVATPEEAGKILSLKDKG